MIRALARRGQHGFSLVGAMAIIAIMMIMMGAALPSWRYVMKNAREEELLFRGMQIADAIERYKKKNGGAPPPSLEALVKGRFLRKAWKDPMTEDGKWRFLRPGEVGPMGPRRLRAKGEREGPGSELFPGAERGLGPFVGVASTNPDESYRTFNGQTKYDEWFFVAGQPHIVGAQSTFGGMGLGMPDRHKFGPGRAGAGGRETQEPPQPQR